QYPEAEEPRASPETSNGGRPVALTFGEPEPRVTLRSSNHQPANLVGFDVRVDRSHSDRVIEPKLNRRSQRPKLNRKARPRVANWVLSYNSMYSPLAAE